MRIPIDSLPLPDAIVLPSGVPDTSTDPRTAVNAQYLWRAAHYIGQQKGTPGVRETVPGRLILQLNMKKVLKEAFLGISRNEESEQARDDLYKWLRETRNLVCVRSLGHAGGDWWVADEWNPLHRGTPAPTEGALTTFKERRVRPTEAGEHRDPLPVISGYRCTEDGCPDTQLFPHPGALADHRAQSHPDTVATSGNIEVVREPGAFLSGEDEDMLRLSPREAVQLEAALDAADEITRLTEGWDDSSPAPSGFTEELLATRIFQAIQASGLTQGKVGEAIGLHGSSISSMITGRQRVNVRQLVEIAQVTGVSPAWLLLGDKGRSAPAPAATVTLSANEASAGELVSLLAARVAAMETDIRDLRAAAGDSELVAELREEIKMHLRTIEQMRGDVHRARKLLGRE